MNFHRAGWLLITVLKPSLNNHRLLDLRIYSSAATNIIAEKATILRSIIIKLIFSVLTDNISYTNKFIHKFVYAST